MLLLRLVINLLSRLSDSYRFGILHVNLLLCQFWYWLLLLLVVTVAVCSVILLVLSHYFLECVIIEIDCTAFVCSSLLLKMLDLLLYIVLGRVTLYRYCILNLVYRHSANSMRLLNLLRLIP